MCVFFFFFFFFFFLLLLFFFFFFFFLCVIFFFFSTKNNNSDLNFFNSQARTQRGAGVFVITFKEHLKIILYFTFDRHYLR